MRYVGMGETCRDCGGPWGLIPCPDGDTGCGVAHFGCRACRARERARELRERDEREVLEALRRAHGLDEEER